MAANSATYLLRPNKTVDRMLFADLLRRLDATLKIESKFRYIGMGGAYMEDFRLLHEYFPRMRMTSLEIEDHIASRQWFNRPHSRIMFMSKSTDAWIAGDIPQRQSLIVWLDFQGTNRSQQITEFQSLIRQIAKPSIVRITLDVSSGKLGGNSELAEKVSILKSQLQPYLPQGFDQNMLVEQGVVEVMRQVVFRAAKESLMNQPDMRFQPLLVDTYADTTRMLTVTGLVASSKSGEKIIAAAKLKDWEFAWVSTQAILGINLPELSPRERLALAQLLPRCRDNVDRIHRWFGYRFDKRQSESEEMLKSYIKFARLYPLFGRISV